MAYWSYARSEEGIDEASVLVSLGYLTGLETNLALCVEELGALNDDCAIDLIGSDDNVLNKKMERKGMKIDTKRFKCKRQSGRDLCN